LKSEKQLKAATRASDGEKTAMAQGVHEDIVMASVMAFINGLNRILVK
jgi:hypothetical protein